MSAAMFPLQFNLADYLLDRNLREGRASKTAILYKDRKISYLEVAENSNRAAQVFSKLGLEYEDRVLIVLPDCPEFAYAWFAALKCGAVFAMVNPLCPQDDFEYYLDYTRAKIAVVHESTLDRMGPAAKKARFLKSLLVVGERSEGWLSFRELYQQASGEFQNADTHRDDIAGWLFTSGSTGKPKAAVHFHHDFAFNIENYAKKVLEIREDDITISVPKLFFGYATGTNLMFPFAVGASTVLFEERSTPEEMLKQIRRHRPTLLTSVPTMINAMAEQEGACREDMSSLRLLTSAGEALPVELYRRWNEKFAVEILDGIGSAELFHIYISNRLGDVKPGSLGKLVPGYEAKILDPEGRELPNGETGTLWVKGDSAALCYWQDHEKSKKVFHDDWVMTGDLFRQDSDGYFWYGGRADELLKVGGIWVSPTEVEACLMKHPRVLEAAVVGVEDRTGLVLSKAFVVLREGEKASEALTRDLQEFAKKNMAPHKYPRLVEYIDSLPKNDRGKVDRKLLKK